MLTEGQKDGMTDMLKTVHPPKSKCRGWTNERTERQMDGHENSIPPPQQTQFAGDINIADSEQSSHTTSHSITGMWNNFVDASF